MHHLFGKTLLALVLAAAMLLCGCTNGAHTPVQPDAPGTTALPDTPAATDALPQSTSQQKTYADAKAAVDAMYPVLDSLVRAMGVGGGNPYTADDASFIWDVLYLTAENWTAQDLRITTRGEWNDIAVVPSPVMQEIAAAAFAGLSELPPVPADMQSLSYDAAGDAYLLDPSDTGDTDTKTEHIAGEADGSIRVTLGLYAGAGERLGAIAFTMADNAQGVHYPCRVTSAQEDPAPYAAWTEVQSGVAFTADLDGDGSAETVTMTFPAGWEDMSAPQVAVSDEGVSHVDTGFEANGDGLFGAHGYLADILAGDGRMELVITGDAASDDYETCIYRYENDTLTRQVVYGAAAGANGGGRLTLETYVNVLGTYGATCEYYMAEDFTFVRESPYTVLRYDGDWAERCLTLQKDALPVTKDYIEQTTLPAGTRLMLVSTDAQSYATLVDESGTLYSVEIEQRPDDWQWYIAGAAESDWFGELMYAG